MEGEFIKSNSVGSAADFDAIEVVIQGAAITDKGQFVPGADRHSRQGSTGAVLDAAAIKLHHRGSTQLDITVRLRGSSGRLIIAPL